MGSCASRPESCVRGRNRKFRRRKKAGCNDGGKRKFFSQEVENSLPSDHSFKTPTFQEIAEEAWFDSAAILESDCSDEDFQSVPDDIHSMSGSDNTSVASPRISNLRDNNANVQSTCPIDQPQRPGDTSTRNTFLNSIGNTRSSVHPDDSDLQVKSEGPAGDVKPVYLDEISTCADDSASGHNGLLDHCGILPNNCLPCLASTVSPVEKRNSQSSSPRKKAALKLTFKWRDGHPNATLLSSKVLLQRPKAGSQVPFSPLEKKIADSWSPVDPGTFRVRGANYMRDKKKDFALNSAAYCPFGVDVFLSPKKINHIARFVELPTMNSSGKLPTMLVVNAQVPLYPTALFQNEIDGEGISFVMYFKLSESYATEFPSHFQDSVRKVIDDEIEKVKGFPGDTTVPYRERLKILGRVANVDDLPLSAAERKLMHAYNEKPVLSRPQHEFFLGDNYLEIDLDMHRFSYISRKGFETFLDRLKFCVLDFGLTIQGNKAEELPENLLCCVRLNEIDYVNYQQLGLGS